MKPQLHADYFEVHDGCLLFYGGRLARGRPCGAVECWDGEVVRWMNELKRMLDALERERFYGAVELKYEAGVVVLIRKSETFKPTEPNYGNNRSLNNERNQSR